MANQPLRFVEREINDNLILTNKKETSEAPARLNKETALLGAEKVTVGVTTSKQVIKVDPVTGLNYLANQVDAQEIYNLRKQSHSAWFALDLETGTRGWYPGSKLVADTVSAVDLKTEMSETSQTIVNIPADTTVELVSNALDESKIKWYEVIYAEYQGYIKATTLSNIRYIDRA